MGVGAGQNPKNSGRNWGKMGVVWLSPPISTWASLIGQEMLCGRGLTLTPPLFQHGALPLVGRDGRGRAGRGFGILGAAGVAAPPPGAAAAAGPAPAHAQQVRPQNVEFLPQNFLFLKISIFLPQNSHFF